MKYVSRCAKVINKYCCFKVNNSSALIVVPYTYRSEVQPFKNKVE